MLRIQTFAAAALSLFCLSIAQAVPAAAQQTKVDFTRIIQRAQALEETYIKFEERTRDEIRALDAVRGKYIMKADGGGYMTLSENDVESLAAHLALFILLEDNESSINDYYGENFLLMPELSALVSGALEDAKTITGISEGKLFGDSILGWRPNYLSTEDREKLAEQVMITFPRRMLEATDDNYVEIAERKRKLEQDIAWRVSRREKLGEKVNRALAQRETAPVSPEPGCSAQAWAGRWCSNYGKMNFTASGGAVSGSYEWDNGTLKGDLDLAACTLTGEWSEEPRKSDRDWGSFSFILNPAAQTWSGTWAYNTKPRGGSWSASRCDG